MILQLAKDVVNNIDNKAIFLKNNYTSCYNAIYIKSLNVPFFNKYKEVGNYNITPMPGCCGVVVLNHVEILEDYRNKKYGHDLVKSAIKRATDEFYSLMLATTNDYSQNMAHILIKHGFELKSTFVSRKTGNTVKLFCKNLNIINHDDSK